MFPSEPTFSSLPFAETAKKVIPLSPEANAERAKTDVNSIAKTSIADNAALKIFFIFFPLFKS